MLARTFACARPPIVSVLRSSILRVLHYDEHVYVQDRAVEELTGQIERVLGCVSG
jgi:hypothetical protein